MRFGDSIGRRVLAGLICAVLTASPWGAVSWAQTEDRSEESLAEDLPRLAPKEPEEALETIRVLNGFQLELLAAEPLVKDPVAIQYDENGLAYVVEMIDYPYSDKSKDVAWEEQTSLPLGRVRILEDVDGDGRFDKSTVFAEELSWPTGLAFWKGGVFVAATPDVLYLKDTDGDCRADVRRKIFTGFRKFNVQAVMNNLKWGLDHKIYAAGSSNSGKIRPGDDPEADPIVLGRSDFRFDPETHQFERIPGGARFGNTFDDWGNRFICNIRNPARHIVLPNRYLAREPYLTVRSAIHDAAEAGDAIPVYRISPPEPWRVINAERLASNTERNSPRSEMVATGYVTSSSGITIYRGAAYPKQYHGNVFIGEVAGNLVMRHRLSAEGPTFRSERVHEESEFIASTDNWFRPVNFVNAPDGTLHVLDMYRETIEHPWSIPEDIKEHLDLISGRDRGRIYRLVPPQERPGFEPPGKPKLGEASIEQLVAELENANSWWRETAHRLIFERQDDEAVEPLRRLLRESPLPLTRLHAAWSLEGLKKLSHEDLHGALHDRASGVREHAVRLAESRLSENAELLDRVIALSKDDAARVRFQVALTLGEVERDQQVVAALRRIAGGDGEGLWMRTAVLSSLGDAAADFLVSLLEDSESAASEAGQTLLRETSRLVGARNRGTDVQQVLEAAQEIGSDSQSAQLAVVLGVGDGLKQRNKSLREIAADQDSSAGELVRCLMSSAGRIAVDDRAEPDRRTQALELLSHGDFEQASEVIPELLDGRQPVSVQRAAVATLSGFACPEVASMLLEKYRGLTPSVRQDVVDALLSRSEWIMSLLDAVAERKVSPALIPPNRRALLMKNSDDDVRERAEELFAADAPGPRKEVIAEYQEALALEPDAARGEEVYRKECIACHRLGEAGHDVGPTLETIRSRTPAQLLEQILDPNREVSPEYMDYVVATTDGRVLTGIIAEETATSITLKREEDKQETILRTEIEELISTGKSLMPEGLEKEITPQELADVIEFLRQPGALRGERSLD